MKEFQIIRFTADKRRYLPASMPRESWMGDEYVKHTDIDIELGQSRYGGPVIDLPEGFVHPLGLRFAAQLDLAKFSPFDRTGLLPQTGQLIFFADIISENGIVFYVDVSNDKLIRHIFEHDDNFFYGVLIDGIFSEVEKWEERFSKTDNEWDDFTGSEKSKIFGIYTHCQLGKDEIEEVTFSDKVLLLQVGEDGFNGEGVFSVLIPKSDLENRNFESCEFTWGQS